MLIGPSDKIIYNGYYVVNKFLSILYPDDPNIILSSHFVLRIKELGDPVNIDLSLYSSNNRKFTTNSSNKLSFGPKIILTSKESSGELLTKEISRIISIFSELIQQNNADHYEHQDNLYRDIGNILDLLREDIQSIDKDIPSFHLKELLIKFNQLITNDKRKMLGGYHLSIPQKLDTLSYIVLPKSDVISIMNDPSKIIIPMGMEIPTQAKLADLSSKQLEELLVYLDSISTFDGRFIGLQESIVKLIAKRIS
jgi:hypothetical protein